MLASWTKSSTPPDLIEQAKRLIDVCLVSVLLDAGAGNQWVYREPDSDLVVGRSEGLAIASLHAFQQGIFSGNKDVPCRVDGKHYFVYPPASMSISLHHISKRTRNFHCR